MNRFNFALAFMLHFCCLTGIAQDFKQYAQGSYLHKKDTIAYRILFPEHFDAQRKYPVVFFLHGRGEQGNDNQKQLKNGGKLFLKEEYRKNFPAIVVFPQCSTDSYWSNVEITTNDKGKREFNFQKRGKATKAMHALMGMLDNFLDKPYVDKSRVYLGGLSMGGMGTYELLRRKPKVFAAAFAICGGDHVANVEKYKNVPLWIFHGEKDDVVPMTYSTLIADQMKVLGKSINLTLYPNANHNSWDSAFAEPKLLPWLFSNHR